MKLNTRSLLLGTALTLPFAGTAFAQQIEINPDQLSGKSAECQDLGQKVADMDGMVEAVSPQDIVTAINEDVAETCATLAGDLGGGMEADQAEADQAEAEAETEENADVNATVEASEEAQTSEEVEISEEAQVTEQLSVEAEALATVPDPDVDVQVPGPEVSVTPGASTVQVDQQAPEIEVEQTQPNVAIEIPEILVRVDIPAPNVYVLVPDPQVSVTSGDPEVAVSQGDPQIEVTQPDPSVQIAIDDSQGGDGDETDSAGATATGDAQGVQKVGGNVTSTIGEPTVQIVQNESEPQIEMSKQDASVTYAGAEPNVSVNFAQQPTIEVTQAGTPNVTYETAEERDQRRAAVQQETEANATDAGPESDSVALTDGQASGEASSAESGQAMDQQQEAGGEVDATAEQSADGEQASVPGMITVGDILAMKVVSANGDDLGTPEAVIDMDGQQMLVISSGGFLGIGDTQVPVALSEVTMQDGQITLQSMTEEQIENANGFEYNSDMALPDDAQVNASN